MTTTGKAEDGELLRRPAGGGVVDGDGGGGKVDGDGGGRSGGGWGRLRLVVVDMVMAFMWVCSGALIKVAARRVFGPEEAAKYCLSVANMFLFAWLGRCTGGGAYNPLTVFASAVSGDLSGFALAVFGRVPSQMIGSIIGVKMIVELFPHAGRGPQLNVATHRGALTEGFLAFAIVTVSLSLKRKDPKSFFMKTWISSISKLSLHILGSDLTGGCMNPASALGWAYARGDHITKAHLFVYCLAPMEATLLAVWIFNWVFQPQKREYLQQETSPKQKSD